MKNKTTTQNNNFILYTSPKGDIKIDVLLKDETIWLTQKKIGELFRVETNTINYHLKEIFKSGELIEEPTIRKIRIVQKEGARDVERESIFYNLDAIISVGYRVNSQQATQFRIWATKVLREFIIKGFTLDDERLKQGKRVFGKDYFDELLERIKEIRASERRFYQKITDIYSQCSIDYDPKAKTTTSFYAKVQNKLHWAISGQTASEIIYNRANANKKNMGLTNWKNSPKGKILKSDVIIAKNYLNENELKNLNDAVNAYLDIAEIQAKNQVATTMKEWVEKLDSFLKMTGYEILEHSGKVKADIAKKLAEDEYAKFRIQQDLEFESDFDRLIKEIQSNKKSKLCKKR
jgi:hypothetical protein